MSSEALPLSPSGDAAEAMKENEAARSLDLNVVRYSRVWEDYKLLLGGLRVRRGQDVILSIASSGDNVLNLLLEEPKKILAFDMSPAQIAFCKLKLAAVLALRHHQDFVWFLGMENKKQAGPDSQTSERSRIQVYRDVVRPVLLESGSFGSEDPADAASYWDAHEHFVEAGVCKCGRLEQYFKAYRDNGFRPPQDLVNAIRRAGTHEQRLAAFDTAFPRGGKHEAAFKSYFGYENQASHGRSEAQMKYVSGEQRGAKNLCSGAGEERGVDIVGANGHPLRRVAGIGAQSVGDWLFAKFKEEILKPRSDYRGGNPYLDLLFYTDEVEDLDARGSIPYLRSSNYTRLRELLGRTGDDAIVELHTTTFETLCDILPRASVDKFNLSDIFEYMDSESCDALFRRMHKVAAPGALVAYWNLYLDRQPSPSISPSLWAPVSEGDDLYPGRHFAYSAFRVDEKQ